MFWGIDINEYPFFHPNFKFVKGSICKTNFEDKFFDLIVSISTLEHIGLGWYGDNTKESDIMAIKEIKRILKKDGLFIMTVPFGIKRETKVFRVYDSNSLNELINGFEVVKADYFVNFNDKYWCISTKEDAEKQDINIRGRNGATVCLVLKNIK